VGGYCLTKDPLFGALAARDLFGLENAFPFSTLAVETNQRTPRVTLERLQSMLGGSLSGKTLLLLGVSYRQDVGDTRYSPSETFVREARARGARVIPHDPLVGHWDEMKEDVARELPGTAGVDAIVFAVPHRDYRTLDFRAWLGGRTPAIFDAFSVLTREQREALRALGCRVESIGRGEGQ
jgi:UDP-N-acetyl-D-mannosaminuronate dehydrogenase